MTRPGWGGVVPYPLPALSASVVDPLMDLHQILFEHGGIVVQFLLAYSVFACTIAVERFIVLLTLPSTPKRVGQTLPEALAQGEAERVLEPLRGPEAEVLRAIYAAHRSGVRDLHAVAVRVGSEQLQRLERGFRSLALIGNTAPLLGLLGTIFGMIKAFMVIQEAGGRVDASALAGGIWEAMITTGVGLSVALPTLVLLHLLEGLADNRAKRMRYFASLLIERLPHSAGGEHDGDEAVAAVHHREGTHAV